jgi:hypothetical protein
MAWHTPFARLGGKSGEALAVLYHVCNGASQVTPSANQEEIMGNLQRNLQQCYRQTLLVLASACDTIVFILCV